MPQSHSGSQAVLGVQTKQYSASKRYIFSVTLQLAAGVLIIGTDRPAIILIHTEISLSSVCHEIYLHIIMPWPMTYGFYFIFIYTLHQITPQVHGLLCDHRHDRYKINMDELRSKYKKMTPQMSSGPHVEAVTYTCGDHSSARTHRNLAFSFDTGM